MQIKRLIVVVVSLIIGVLLTGAVIYLGFGTTPERFAYSNVVLLTVSLAGIAFIWLDYLLGTQFLKN